MWPTSCADSCRSRASTTSVDLRRLLGAGRVRREQAFENQVVLPHAQRAERDVALDDLARARIGNRIAVAPAARRTVDPRDRVVAHVHRVGAFGHDLDLEAVAEAGGLERLVPPARAFDQRGPDRLRRAAIDVIDDRLHRIAHRRRRIALLDAMAADELLAHRLAERRGDSRRSRSRRSPSADRTRAACSCASGSSMNE